MELIFQKPAVRADAFAALEPVDSALLSLSPLAACVAASPPKAEAIFFGHAQHRARLSRCHAALWKRDLGDHRGW